VTRSPASATPDELLAYLRTRLLPLWARHGFDERHGGFHNRLVPSTREPAPDPNKRLVVQTRQIFAFAWAARLFGEPLFLERALAGFEFLRTRYRDRAHGGWFLTVTPEGEPLDRGKDAYAHAFVLFALAELARLPDARLRATALELARETTDLIAARLGDPEHGGFLEGASEDWTPLRGTRRQNPHMHLFEAFLALDAASRDPAYLEHARRIGALLCAHWIDPERGCLYEHFRPAWQVDLAVEGGAIEPGHCFEWYWLLHQHRALREQADLCHAAQALWRFGSSKGLDPQDGAPFDAVSADGAVLRDRKRAWPQTEYLKALGMRVEWHDCAESEKRLRAFVALCMDRYVDAATGGWSEHMDRAGRRISPLMNATTVYHVMIALLETARVLRTRG
jgi:mannose-6-phosphate isomerase